MILPDFVLPLRVNEHWEYSGIDSPELCYNKAHFKSYPFLVDYRYNSRGFRDKEWPNSIEELDNSIWCIGDSFTTGIGSAFENTWVQVLQKQVNCRTINVSLDGASNEWIARKAIALLTTLAPKTIIIHWSYTHRRELDYMTALKQRWELCYAACRDETWPVDVKLEDFSKLSVTRQLELQYRHGWDWKVLDDSSRLLFCVDSSTNEDLELTIECMNAVNSYSGDCKIIHSVIPAFIKKDMYHTFYSKLPANFDLLEIKQLDLARDGHHYDIATSKLFVEQLLSRLSD